MFSPHRKCLNNGLQLFGLILLLIIHTEALSVDNQLVSARNDCFERIALEAMLPFEKAFRTEDTNSLRMCKEKCLNAGDKCQSIAFGVHRRGNGTCQLSTEKFDAAAGRPRGIIFDPDFDLYGRKTNCFDLSDNTIPQSDAITPTGSGGDIPGYGQSPTPTIHLPNRPPEGTTSILVVNPTPSTSTAYDDPRRPTAGVPTASTGYGGGGGGVSTTLHYIPDTRPTPTFGTRPTTTGVGVGVTPTDGDRLYFTHDLYPLYQYPMLYEHNYPSPNQDVYIPGGYASNVPPLNDRYRPPGEYGSSSVGPMDDARPTTHGPPRPIFGLGYGNGYSYGKPEKYYPTTIRPYTEQDRPGYGGGVSVRPPPYGSGGDPRPTYAGSTNSDRPTYGTSNRPSYGSGDRPPYGANNDRPPYGANNDRPPYGVNNDRPPYGVNNDRPPYGANNDRPPYGANNDRPTYGASDRPIPASRPYDRPPYGNDPRPTPEAIRPADHTTPSNPYYPRPEYGAGGGGPRPSSLSPTAPGSPQRPGDFVDYTNRPDPPLPLGAGTSMHPPPLRDPTPGYDFARRNGTAAAHPDGGYQDDKTIATYFNPEDYMPDGHRGRPGGGFRPPLDYSINSMRACFRRVLAGKRIAPHWVRRTIACERVEECMRECGQEKRFMCEGFNYRLDPSGHGQGDCELIEVPLAKMDLYSSPHRRDSNLLRHPDYDYYERDRNAPSSCRVRPTCADCTKGGPLASGPLYFSGGGSGKPHREEQYPQVPPPPPYNDRDRDRDHYPPPSGGGGSSTALDHYRPSGPPISYDHRRPPPPPPSSSGSDYHSGSFGSYEFSSHGGGPYYEHTPPSASGPGPGPGPGPIDRYDFIRPEDHYSSRPDRWKSVSSGSSSGYDDRYRPPPRPLGDSDHYRPPYRPGSDYSPYRDRDRDRPLSSGPSGPSTYHHLPPPPPPSHNYLDRGDGPGGDYKKSGKFVPYLIGSTETGHTSPYSGGYGDGGGKHSSTYWGLSDEEYHNRRKDQLDFNYFDLGGSRRRGPNAILSYPGSDYDGADGFRDRHDYRHLWTRRPGPDECSAKTSEGFRLHKAAVKHMTNVPTLTECERLCSGQQGFICHTYSYRYTQTPGRDNCMLCDRPVNRLDYYVDIEPDRDYDIYSMADDFGACRPPPSRADHGHPPPPLDSHVSTALSDPRNAQCFFRAIDGTRFFKSIVRDSLTVRSVGECEMECIKSTKFTCRAFSFCYGQGQGQQRGGSSGIIDNCLLSDWPVRDMDRERHLVRDKAFDVFERASYGHGCEIQPIVDEKHKKLCYLGYGSAAKLLPAAIKKTITVRSERECKEECARFRETTSFKCFSFSFGSHSSSHNCLMSDLDQTELKPNVHFTHMEGNDYWLFAWNPFDWTCRDKVATIGGSRVNNDRRMDIFREPGDLEWRHYSVSGKPCRRGSPCAKNLVSGFYSCELESSEVGSWDYCCKSDHPCGYSRGFSYPWCFVGDEADQWRKCSDRYFPTRGSGGNRTHGTHADIAQLASQHKDTKKKGGPPSGNSAANSSEFQRPPRPGGLQSLSDFAVARLWPVTYLYSEGPPNATEFSNFVDCNKESC